MNRRFSLYSTTRGYETKANDNDDMMIPKTTLKLCEVGEVERIM